MPAFSFGRAMCPACEKQTAPYREKYADLHHEAASGEGMITKGLVILNVIIFGMMVLNGVSPTQPDGRDLFRWGSEFGPYTLGPQPWRLFTCMFLHIGILHLAFNMWCLWDLGQVAERIYGRAWFLFLYLASGICGSYLSLLWNPLRSSAGASGAIFGVCGALIAAFKFGSLAFDPTRVRAMLRSVTLFAIYNLVFGLIGGINNMAHLGGLIGGVAIGFLLTRLFPPHSEEYKRSFFWLTPLLTIALVGGYFGLRYLKASTIALGQGALQAEGGDCRSALPKLEHAAAADPNNPDIHEELGYCYLTLQRPDDAIREFERTAALDPKDPYPLQQLGWLAMEKKDDKKAVDAFQRAAAIDPKDPDTLRGLTIVLADLGRTDEAVKAGEQAVQLAPKDVKVLSALDYAYQRAGRIPDAIKLARQMVELTPNDPDVHEELAELLEKTGDTKGAAEQRAIAAKLPKSDTDR